MRDLKDINLCSNGGDLLAYLYDEMPAADRDSFELHLADCGTCIDDFAEISQGRYPVFEWKSLEFDPMPTPGFVMPAQATAIGFFDKLRAAFAIQRGFAFDGVAIAVLVAVLVVYAFYLQSGPEKDVAVANPEPIASQTQRVIPPATTPEISSSARIENDEPERAMQKSSPKRSAPVKASALKPRPIQPVRTSDEKTQVKPQKQLRQIPVLSVAEDDEDETLRLADMFDDIGAS